MTRLSLDSLRLRLLLLVALALIPVVGLALYVSGEQRQLAADAARTDAQQLALVALAEQEELIGNTQHLLATLAQLPVVRAGDPEACSRFLATVADEYRFYSGFIVAAASGDITCSSLPGSEPINVGDRSWFRGVMDTKEFAIGEYAVAPLSELSVLPLAYPIFDEVGEVRSVLATGFDLSWLYVLAGRVRPASGSTMTVIDRDGTVLSRYPEGADWVGRAMPEVPIVRQVLATRGEGTAEAPGIDGIPRLFAFAPLRMGDEIGTDADLFVVVGLPSSAAFARANRLLLEHLGGVALVALLALGAAWYVGDRLIVREVDSLREASGQLAGGELSVRIGPPYRSGELGQMGQAFDRMAGALERREEERDRAQQAVLRREAQLAEAQRIAHIGSWEWDIPSNDVRWSDEMHRVYGLVPGQVEVSYGRFLDRVHPDDRERVAAIIEQAYADHKPFELQHRVVRPDGSVRTLLGRGKVVVNESGQPVRMVGTGQDITERQQMEEQVREAKALFEGLFEHAPDGILLASAEGRIVRVNRQVEEMFSYSRDEMQGKPVETLVPERFRAAHAGHRAGYSSHPRTRPMGADRDLFARRKDSSEFPVDIMLSPLETDQGVLIISIIRDITIDKRREDQLRKLSRAVENTSAAVFVYNTQGEIEYVNPAFTTLTGYAVEEIVGRPVSHLGSNPPELNHEIWSVISAGQVWKGEIPNRRKNGEPYWALSSIAPIRNGDGDITHFVEIHDDITGRKQMEAELTETQYRLSEAREAERLHLAQELHDGPIQDLHALDFRLVSLQSHVSGDGPETLADAHATVQKVTETLRMICGELRPPTLVPFGLAVAIRSHAEQFEEQHPELEVGLDLTEDGQRLPERVRLALYRIYQQAMANTAQHAEAKNVLVRFVLDDERVVLEVRDDGCGFEVPKRWITLARQDHLGLVGAVERAEAIDGRLEIVSEPGAGTTLRVVAPRSADSAIPGTMLDSSSEGMVSNESHTRAAG